MIVYRHLVPLDADDVERAAALGEVGSIYDALLENGEDATVGISTTADGDEFVFEIADIAGV